MTLYTPEGIAGIVRQATERYKLLQDPFEISEVLAILQAHFPHNFLEIGSYGGGTFACWASIITGKKISLDLPPSDVDVTDRDARLTQDFSDVHILHGDSHDMSNIDRIANILGDETVDFLFIDGDHSQSGCRADYDNYLRFVTPDRGIVAFHDIVDSPRHRSEGCYVGPAFQSIPGKRIEVRGGNSWGGIGLIFLADYGRCPYVEYK